MGGAAGSFLRRGSWGREVLAPGVLRGRSMIYIYISKRENISVGERVSFKESLVF